ncbi:MAG: electron transfer flavoprotein subunit beta/FixA family protein [Chitinophagaceae bacterium]
MNILVCISKAPDTTAKIAFTDNNTKFATEGVQWIINPYDEWYALTKAIEMKEKENSIQIILVTVGAADTEPIIRKALALGGDEAVRINAADFDSYQVASYISNIARERNCELILTGKETIDHNNASVGGMIASLLDYPFVSLATKMTNEGPIFTLNREIEGGEETVKANLPLVVSCQKGMAEARIPNMRGIMAARTKPLNIVEPAVIERFTEVVSFETPPTKAGVKLIPPDNMDELVRLLHEESKVI